MKRTRFFIAQSSIKTFFKTASKRVFTINQLEAVLEEHRSLWNLPFSMNVKKFIDKLIDSNIIQKKIIEFEGYLSEKEIYICEDASIYQISLSLINKSYLSHYSAAFVNGLTTQIPKTVYLTFEQSKKQNVNSHLEQSRIDGAFLKPQKMSGTKAVIDEYTLLIHNGMYTNKTGVYGLNDISITNIERTLIDITVRPNYAGGVFSVLEIYRNAISKISINKLVAILDNIAFIYPYHQAIGFYLERAGFDRDKLNPLKKKVMQFKFYLTYDMTEKEYSSDWMLYYPKGM